MFSFLLISVKQNNQLPVTSGCHLYINSLISIGIPKIKIRWSHDSLVFIMETPIPGKNVFIFIETQPEAVMIVWHYCNDLNLLEHRDKLRLIIIHHIAFTLNLYLLKSYDFFSMNTGPKCWYFCKQNELIKLREEQINPKLSLAGMVTLK